jgi:hypothetical protein
MFVQIAPAINSPTFGPPGIFADHNPLLPIFNASSLRCRTRHCITNICSKAANQLAAQASLLAGQTVTLSACVACGDVVKIRGHCDHVIRAWYPRNAYCTRR